MKEMLDKEKVHIGIAPIAWTEDDMPEMGAGNSFLQTLSEISLSGYTGTEIGCQYPRNPAILNEEFKRRGLSAITAWISTYLNEQPMWWNERAFVDHMNFLKAIGAELINVSDQSFSIQHQWNTPLVNKKVLNDDEWDVLTKGLDHLGRIASDNGMDEPTSSLTDNEVEQLFKIIADLKAKNVAIIYISHKMEEIFRISDDITVYRDGEYIASDKAENLDVNKVIKLMVGREMTSMSSRLRHYLFVNSRLSRIITYVTLSRLHTATSRLFAALRKCFPPLWDVFSRRNTAFFPN